MHSAKKAFSWRLNGAGLYYSQLQLELVFAVYCRLTIVMVSPPQLRERQVGQPAHTMMPATQNSTNMPARDAP